MKTNGRNLPLLLCATLGSIILAEILVRIFAPQQLIILRPDIWQPTNVLGYRHHENANTVVNLGEATVHLVGKSTRLQAAIQKTTHLFMGTDLILTAIAATLPAAILTLLLPVLFPRFATAALAVPSLLLILVMCQRIIRYQSNILKLRRAISMLCVLYGLGAVATAGLMVIGVFTNAPLWMLSLLLAAV